MVQSLGEINKEIEREQVRELEELLRLEFGLLLLIEKTFETLERERERKRLLSCLALGMLFLLMMAVPLPCWLKLF